MERTDLDFSVGLSYSEIAKALEWIVLSSCHPLATTSEMELRYLATCEKDIVLKKAEEQMLVNTYLKLKNSDFPEANRIYQATKNIKNEIREREEKLHKLPSKKQIYQRVLAFIESNS